MEEIITICTCFNHSNNPAINFKSMEHKQRCSNTIIISVSVIKTLRLNT